MSSTNSLHPLGAVEYIHIWCFSSDQFFLYLWTKSFPLSSDSDLHDVFDQRLVGADLGALQSTDTVSDPGDERELGPFAHGVSCCESEEAEQTSVVWRKRGKRKGQGQRSKGNRVSFLPELSLT